MSKTEEDKELTTAKSKYFDNVDIITRRPDGMDYDEYKSLMRSQKKMIKLYLKGELTFLSKLYRAPEVMARFGLTMESTPVDIYKASQVKGQEAAMLLLKGRTYERD